MGISFSSAVSDEYCKKHAIDYCQDCADECVERDKREDYSNSVISVSVDDKLDKYVPLLNTEYMMDIIGKYISFINVCSGPSINLRYDTMHNQLSDKLVIVLNMINETSLASYIMYNGTVNGLMFDRLKFIYNQMSSGSDDNS